MIKCIGFLGGKKQIKSLGGFMIVVFGIVDLFLEFSKDPVEPSWIIWFFRGGIILGIVLLIGGLLAVDMPKD